MVSAPGWPPPVGSPPRRRGNQHDRDQRGDLMIVRTVLAATAVIALAATAVVAQQDPIAARKELMKGNGRAAQLGTKMTKGEEPFTVEKGKSVFASYQKVATAHNLWPDNSKTGGDTASLPAVWENKADFESRLTKT